MGKKKNNFLVQGSILAIAGILTRVIGLIYRIPLNKILGDGASAYTIAYDIYSLFLLISSLSLPLAVSKLVAARMAKGEVKNAKRVLIGSLSIAVVIGLAVSILVYVFADDLAAMWKFECATIALRILAPTLFVMCILGVLRGFFQGLGSMVPTAISQIVEQIINALVSVIAAYILFDEGLKIGREVEYSAAGGTLGTAMGAVFALLFMICVYMLYRRNFNKMMKKDPATEQESYKTLAKVLVITIFPVLLSTTIYNIGSIIDSGLYGNIMNGFFEYEESEYMPYWSVYSSQYRLLTTAPIAIASALSSAVVPSLIKSITNKDYKMLKEKITSSVKLTMLIAIPCGMGLSVLADPIIETFFGRLDIHEDTVLLMRLSVFVVVAYSYSTITNSVLQGIDKMKLPVKHSAIALGIHVVVITILLFMKTDVFGVALADIIFAVCVCVMNSRAIYNETGRKQEIKYSFVLPFLASAIMGAVCAIVYYGLNALTKAVAVPMFIAIAVAVIVYGVELVLFGVVDEVEIKSFPMGKKLVVLLKKIKLM